MPDELIKNIQALHGEGKARRSNFEARWQQIADHCVGRRDFTTRELSEGRSRQLPIFDTTFQQAQQQLQAALQTMLIPSASPWFWPVPLDRGLLEDHDVATYFDQLAIAMYAGYQHPEAGFNTQSSEMLTDLTSFSNGILFEDWDDDIDAPRFECWPLQDCFWLRNKQGNIDAIVREVFLTPKQVVEMFGETAPPDTIMQDETGHGPSLTTNRYLWYIGPSNRGVLANSPANTNRAFTSIWVETKRGRLAKDPEGYHSKPFFPVRWSVDPGESYGRGPSDRGLTDGTQLNIIMRTMIEQAQLSVAPPTIVEHDSTMSPVRLAPRSQIVVRPGFGNREPVRPFEMPSRFDIGEWVVTQMREQVRSAFYHELLSTFDDPRMTATQVLELSSRTAQLIGPAIFRMHNEWLEPMNERHFDLLDRHGWLPELPEALLNTEARFDYVSPAARAQRNADVNQVAAYVDQLAMWSQFDDEVMDNVDMDDAAAVLAESLAIPARMRRSSDEREDIREARNAVAQQQAQADQMAQMAEAAGKAAPAMQAAQEMGGPPQ